METKKILKYTMGITLVAASLSSLTSCIEETFPTSVATEDQMQQSSASAEAALMALPSNFNAYGGSYGHFGFGYGAMMTIRDVQTGDYMHSYLGYDHFNAWAENKYQGDGYLIGQYIYNYYNEFVLACNTMVGAVDPENASDKQLGYLGAGLAFRALVYLDMARCYEYLPNDKTSNINADGNDVLHLTVPIVTAEMDQAAAKNNPRATREQMRDFIENDLNNAEKYIVNLKSFSDNTLPDLACVYGLKARLYMWVEDYPKAQEYARKAINAARVDPMTEEECNNITTGFNDISKWMWGSKQTSEDNTVKSGIINWTSWRSNQTSYGYTGTGTGMFSQMDKRMYERISDTDFRKVQFLAPEGSPLRDATRFLPEMKEALLESMPAYTALKFRPNEGNPDVYVTSAASCYPVMRVEEMYFIEAEAAAHQNEANGLELLKKFMTENRDPSYTTKVTSKDDVIEEIIFQKRVEFWGEGQTFFDIKRLNYSVTRGYPGTNWEDNNARFNTNGRPAWMNYVIVRTESNNNQGLVGMNNPDPSDSYTPWTE
ncbi:MAG: RagB/SusD family nutrient uptake outer membrane protein [Prevotella sp.]